MTTPDPVAQSAAAHTAPRVASTTRPRPMRVHWSMQSAAREAGLKQTNTRRTSTRQTRKLGCEDDPELFFNNDTVARREAQRICWDCPVRRQCLEVALSTEVSAQTSSAGYSNGTVGGVTASVRERLVRARRLQQRARSPRAVAVRAAGSTGRSAHQTRDDRPTAKRKSAKTV